MTRIAITLAAAAAALLAAPANAQHGPPVSSDKTVNLQGDPGAFGVEERMMPFYQVLLETHKQGDKADLAVMEGRIRALLPTLSGGQAPSKAMEDHVMGVAHQALALGVSNPKMFESYKAFMAEMMGPQ
jgi:hypothetical protein